MKRHRIASTLISVAIAAALPGAANAVRIDYVVDSGYERNDNVSLSETNPSEQNIFRLGLGFSLEQNSSTVQASLSGRVDHLRYEDIYDNSTDRMLSGRLNWMIVPERLGFVVEDSYGVNTINRFDPGTPDNRQQVNVLSLGPNFYFNAGARLRGQAELRFINSHAEITEDFNSDRIAAALRIIKEIDPVSSLSLNLQTQDIDFDNDLVGRDHVRTEAFASYQRRLNLFDLQLEAGYSFLDFDQGGDYSNPLFRAELGWNPRERSRFAVNLEHSISDAATNALTTIDETTGIPSSVITGSSTVTASPYELSSVSISYEYIGVRTMFSAYAGRQELDYILAITANEESRNAGFSASYQLRPSLVLRGSASINRMDYNTIPTSKQDDRLYSVILEKRWGRRWATSLGYTRYERGGSTSMAEFEQNILYFNIAYSNR